MRQESGRRELEGSEGNACDQTHKQKKINIKSCYVSSSCFVIQGLRLGCLIILKNGNFK